MEGLAGPRRSFAAYALAKAAAEAEADLAAGRDPVGSSRTAMLSAALRSMRAKRSETDEARSLALRCLHLGMALAARDRDAVAPHELATALAALGQVSPAVRDAIASDIPPPRERPPVPPTLPTVVPFALPWRDGRNAWRMGKGLCTIRAVPPGTVRIGATLRTPAGALAVPVVDDAWYRPLFAPGSWEPVTLEGFFEAVADGRPWADNPFVPWAGPGRVQFPLATVTIPGHQAQGNDARRVSRDEAEALARAGALRAIDGIVHRASHEPVLDLALPTDGREPSPAFVWRMDRVHSGSTQDTLDPRGPCLEPGGLSMSGPSGRLPPVTVSLPLSRLGDARVVASVLASSGLADPLLPAKAPDAGHDPGACLSEAAGILAAQGRLDGARLADAVRAGTRGDPGFAEAVRAAVPGMPTSRAAPGDLAQAVAAALATAAAEGMAAVAARHGDDSSDDMGSFVP